MTEHIDPATFLERFDPHGRSIIGLTETEGVYRLSLDLFHCDDPARADETLTYPVDLFLRTHEVRFAEGLDIALGGAFSGDVIAAGASNAGLRLVASCTRADPRRDFVLDLTVDAPAIDVAGHDPQPVSPAGTGSAH